LVQLKDNLNNIILSTNANWNSSCSNDGCYEISFSAPSNLGKYDLSVTLSYNGDSQTNNRVVNVVNGYISAQSTDNDGNIKELFGTNEYAYFKLNSYNQNNSLFNLSQAEIFIVSYMNGSYISYSQVDNFSSVNLSNSAYEWAWNSSEQKLKLDVPKFGGLYDVYIFGNNRSYGTNVKFIVNPYDSCIVTKDSASSSSGVWYSWQFKTSDTIYFDIKLTEANNPLGKASASNLSGNNSYSASGSSSCYVNTQTKKVIANATLRIIEVKNLESGAVQSINSSESVCQASDSSGGYVCTIKPLTKWEGGVNVVKFSVTGSDGTSAIVYSRFESRAFYIYGWSQYLRTLTIFE
jgi:hypothetical protein